jgi:DnaJ-class molecular chaperone
MNHYQVLNIDKGASQEDIRKAYKALVLKYHPDKKTGCRDAFDKVQEAYAILSDPDKKTIYDASLNVKEDDAALNTLIILMMDLLSKQFEAALKSQKQIPPQAKPQPQTPRPNKRNIVISLDVDLVDIYNESIKKVVTKVKRNGEWVSQPVYINLAENKSQYTYKGLADDGGDIIVNIKVKEHSYIKRDTILYDHDLYIEKDISLYEYLYGVDTNIEYFNGEQLHIIIDPKKAKQGHVSTYHTLTHTLTHVIEGYGLPYVAKDSTIEYGNLYIYFHLSLPDADNIPVEARDILKEYCK